MRRYRINHIHPHKCTLYIKRLKKKKPHTQAHTFHVYFLFDEIKKDLCSWRQTNFIWWTNGIFPDKKKCTIHLQAKSHRWSQLLMHLYQIKFTSSQGHRYKIITINMKNFLKYIKKWSTWFIRLNLINPRHYCRPINNLSNTLVTSLSLKNISTIFILMKEL